MNLNHKWLQVLLAKCFFGESWEKYRDCVIPYQGNILNPMQTETKASCALMYTLLERKRIIDNRKDGDTHLATLQDRIILSALGEGAEEVITSTLFWDERADIARCFAEQDAQLMNSARDIQAEAYDQEGVNSTLIYTTVLEVVHTVSLTEINPTIADGNVVFGGTIFVRR